jgi:hypothetical protein
MAGTCGCIDKFGRAKGGQHMEVWDLVDRKTKKHYVICAIDLTEMLVMIRHSQRPGDLPKILNERGVAGFECTLKTCVHGIGNMGSVAAKIAERLRKQGHEVECA